MPQSIWMDSVKLPEFETLHGALKTDVLIIGGGLCGILCAYFLKEAGVDCVLVEGNRIGSGTTGNTTAKITSQHGLIYDKLLRTAGREKASAYLYSNEKALEKYRKLAREIPCDFREKDAFVYSLKDREKLEKEAKAVNSLGFPAEISEELPLPFKTVGAVCFPRQAQFHPLKFMAGIAQNLPVYEHTFIKELEPHRAFSADGEVRADKIIVATHFPFLNKNGSYFLKLYQHRSYVIALEKKEGGCTGRNSLFMDGMYIDEDQKGFSFRNYENLLLLGGGSHRTGKAGGTYRELRSLAAKYYPQAGEVYHWAAQDCMSLDNIPYIGRYSRHTPDLYVASGFHKWGMTSAMVSAMLLRDMILEIENEWSELYTPSRSMLKPQLFINGMEAVGNLITPAKKRCPHMGCALKWNAQEHTWDCPCHGSRFEKDGTLIDNPATGGIEL